MKLPVSWLKEYVDFDDSTAGLSDKLTFSGTEVEGIEELGLNAEGVIVGEVRKVAQHPNADRLRICTVFNGTDEVQVVCGAPNVTEGGKYPFAPIGSVLDSGAFKIKKAKLRGELSQGMLCAEDELGLSEEHDGLMDLPADSIPGTPFEEICGPSEIVFELEVTPNRPDCLSMMGMAREVAAMYNSCLKRPPCPLSESSKGIEDFTSVQIHDTERCPRYTARVLQDVKIGPSPDWMQRMLTASGVRPINNVVDITNFVMLECGQPLHAFDMDLLAEGRIEVRRANDGEKMLTLDGQEHELTDDMLLICDAEKPVALAGIMGGGNSEINDGTTNVLLESAYFEPSGIRRTARALGMASESSYRFERGADLGGTERASRRAASLLIEYAGAKAVKGVMDVYPTPRPEREVYCRWGSVSTLLGMSISPEAIRKTLAPIELIVDVADAEGASFSIPSFRVDLTREADLIEEFARLHGLDKIPTQPPASRVIDGADDSKLCAVYELRDLAAGLGLNECVNYSLISEKLMQPFVKDMPSVVKLPNPISQDQSILRPSLLPQMLEVLTHNRARQLQEGAFYEVGRCFCEQDGTRKEADRLCIGMMGPLQRPFHDKRRPVEEREIFAWLKGLLENLFAALNLEEPKLQACDRSFFAKGRAAEILLGGKVIGTMGLLNAKLGKSRRFTDSVALAELDVESLLIQWNDIPVASAPSSFPATQRDMALVAPSELRHEEIVAVIKAAASAELRKVELFDIFEGDAIGKGKKSMAYSLTYQSETKTLKDEEANRFHETIKAAVRKKLPVELREG